MKSSEASSVFTGCLHVRLLYLQLLTSLIKANYKTMKPVVCLGDCLIFAKCIIFCFHWLTSPYLLIKANYKTMKYVVCLGDCLIFAKCIIFCVHWLPACQTPIPTVANKPHIY